ncbi:isoamylase early set domain-containing protein [Planobispora takensis]|uniref:Glycoside hydrolase family 13 N-terminal domain-containing protein n=1 Tax=Planobispora takensis TaxID=1367882 RepID=A0A8J3SQ89_9ACTN|nr:isoamylase early set domain-containing protein [Planobispora takensis]GIH98317.1 hypothetical protein Pta02_03260 [Planobispora takensis]
MIKRGKPTKNGQVKLTFTVPADRAPGGISLVGDFNGWNPYAHPMQRKNDGTYQVTVTVPAGEGICFRYLADGGVWFDDADADRHDHHGGHLDAIEIRIPQPEAVGKPAAARMEEPVREPAKESVKVPAKTPAKAPAKTSVARVPAKKPLAPSAPAPAPVPA